jgi:hypothetical protein
MDEYIVSQKGKSGFYVCNINCKDYAVPLDTPTCLNKTILGFLTDRKEFTVKKVTPADPEVTADPEAETQEASDVEESDND